MGLNPNWNGVTPYEFYENATYTCNSSSTWFEHDREQLNFNVTCLPGGRWKTPQEWPKCVPSKDFLIILEKASMPRQILAVECPDPPTKPQGGKMIWNGDKTYGALARYRPY